MTDTTPDPSDPNGDGSTPTKVSFLKRARKSIAAAGVAFLGLLSSFTPGVFSDIGLQAAGQNPDWAILVWTDLGILIPTVGAAFVATWKITNYKADGSKNLDSAKPDPAAG